MGPDSAEYAAKQQYRTQNQVKRFTGITLLRCAVLLYVVALCFASSALAQDNYEIQVYGAETLEPGSTMIELHSNFTMDGSKVPVDGTQPTNHALHETAEITQGFTSWFETGFYLFTSVRSGTGWQYVGNHIRPRVRVPESCHWPLGVSLSNEIGYQRRQFSVDTWTWEIRPIVDKTIGSWYLSFNPTLDRALHGPSVSRGFEFSPNAKVSYDVTRQITAGLEYYGALGPMTGFDPVRDQQQHIVGRRFSWKHHSKH